MNNTKLKKWRENYTPFTGVCVSQGLKLYVHFDEKDILKRIGAKWNPDPSGKGGYWWMPSDLLDLHVIDCYGDGGGDCPTIVNKFHHAAFIPSVNSTEREMTVQEWLNHNRMISKETHGLLNPTKCREVTRSETYVEYLLKHPTGEGVFVFHFFKETDLVMMWDGRTDSMKSWCTHPDGRDAWDMLVKSGWSRASSMETKKIDS